jgi:hypothetical protein
MHSDSGLAGSWIGMTNMPSLSGCERLIHHLPGRVELDRRVMHILDPRRRQG